MSTTVSYKGNTLTTVNNNTKTLETEGKYLEADIILTDVSGGITPTGNINITSSGQTDVTQYATATVPLAEYLTGVDHEYYTDNNVRKWHFRGKTELDTSEGDVEGWIGNGTQYGEYVVRNAIASGTSVTPTESSQTIGGANYMMEGAVTVNAIPSNYVGSGITRRNSSDIGIFGNIVLVYPGYYADEGQAMIPSGTEGTPIATKSAVSNHAVTVTPSVTNSTGYIVGSTKTGTAVTVSASELVSGNLPITENGNNIDCANYSTVSVNVPTGGGSVNIDTKTVTATNYPVSISFSSMQGQPKAFFLRSTTQISSSGSTAYYYIIDMRYNGTNTTGNCFRIGSTRRVENITSGYSWSYSGTTLTITSSASSRSYSPGAFNNGYELVYIY